MCLIQIRFYLYDTKTSRARLEGLGFSLLCVFSVWGGGGGGLWRLVLLEQGSFAIE